MAVSVTRTVRRGFDRESSDERVRRIDRVGRLAATSARDDEASCAGRTTSESEVASEVVLAAARRRACRWRWGSSGVAGFDKDASSALVEGRDEGGELGDVGVVVAVVAFDAEARAAWSTSRSRPGRGFTPRSKALLERK